MSMFEFPKAIRSRPTYATLVPRAGSNHLMVADAEGAEALFDLAAADAALMAKAQVIYIPKKTGERYLAQLAALSPLHLYIAVDYADCAEHLAPLLQSAQMGVQVYLAGTEGLMGQAETAATRAGISVASIQSEHRGATGRRMQCVHCKGFTEDVTTDPFVCGHCGLNLFVRDHYSRRLAAFQAVCIDAEDPGNVPPQKALYP